MKGGVFFYLVRCWAEYFSLSLASFDVPFRTLDISRDQTLGLAWAVLYSATLQGCQKRKGRQGCVIKFPRVPKLEAVCFRCITVCKEPYFAEIMGLFPGIMQTTCRDVTRDKEERDVLWNSSGFQNVMLSVSIAFLCARSLISLKSCAYFLE